MTKWLRGQWQLKGRILHFPQQFQRLQHITSGAVRWRRVEWSIPQQRGCREKGTSAHGWLLSFKPLILSGLSAHRMVPHTFRVGLFSSFMFSWTCLHRCTQRVSFSSLTSDPEPSKTDHGDEPSHRTFFVMDSPFIIEKCFHYLRWLFLIHSVCVY